MKKCTEIVAADLNSLGSVGDLYCFSNTHSMLVNQAIKDKLTMNSSNYTLVTYLSDIECKFIPCHFCILRLSYFDGLMSTSIRQNSPVVLVRLGYYFTPYQRLWLYNGAHLVTFYDTLGIRRTYSRLEPPASSRGLSRFGNYAKSIYHQTSSFHCAYLHVPTEMDSIN